jgi:hypothetical protein
MKNILFMLGIILIGTAMGSNAYSAWGCGAQNGSVAWGDSFNESSKSAAQKTALSGCQQSRQPGEAPCRIVGCSPNINSGDQADAKWELR